LKIGGAYTIPRVVGFVTSEIFHDPSLDYLGHQVGLLGSSAMAFEEINNKDLLGSGSQLAVKVGATGLIGGITLYLMAHAPMPDVPAVVTDIAKVPQALYNFTNDKIVSPVLGFQVKETLATIAGIGTGIYTSIKNAMP
jgi:hypothetical protein